MRALVVAVVMTVAGSAVAERRIRLPDACRVLVDIGVLTSEALRSDDGSKGSVGFGGPPTKMSSCMTFASSNPGRTVARISVMEFLADSDPYRQYADYVPPERLTAVLLAQTRKGAIVRPLDTFDVPAFWFEGDGSLLLFSKDARVRISLSHADGRDAAEALARRILARHADRLR